MKPISPIYINVKGRLLDLATPQVMGILNVTPDSFYAGSRMHPGWCFEHNCSLGFSPYHKINIFSGEKLLSFAIKISGGRTCCRSHPSKCRWKYFAICITKIQQTAKDKMWISSHLPPIFGEFWSSDVFLYRYFVIKITLTNAIHPIFTWRISHKRSSTGQLNDSVPDFAVSTGSGYLLPLH